MYSKIEVVLFEKGFYHVHELVMCDDDTLLILEKCTASTHPDYNYDYTYCFWK